jgi:hypothetical protein
MRYAKLTDEELYQAIYESHTAIANYSKYQAFLMTGKGLPKNDLLRSQLIASNVKMMEQIHADIDDMESVVTARSKKKARRRG